MKRLTDTELIDELKKRFQEQEKALHDLRVMTKKLEFMNKKLQESESLKSSFLSNIKNEINNPLAAILGLSEQLIKSAIKAKSDPDDISTMASLIYQEAFGLDFQLKNVFIAAELEAGEAVPGISIVDCFSIINATIGLFKHIAEGKGITLNFIHDCAEGTDSEPFFKTDPEKLQIVVANLLSNAIEFGPEGSEVEIKVWRESNELRITVKDHGIGISEEEKYAIFDRFRQLETGSTKTHKGHGLGLSITKAIVEMLNGEITVASTKGKGSIFSVSIPESETDTNSDVFSADGNEFLFDEEGEF
ncbi:MAG: HAMP domain-containing histidine kinase [Magnetococcales bacterium]|uniref:histidine kinase n=1 Tax=Candidatus Magnetobacterium casense TaxID=1455061 RepID=A0ABS6RVN1_9BACT|nr:HAMP domain-containing sensor histidine kinase [Candidatus Magnetobacterium casensis]MBF0607724.1 HAMP domain-containing histidine kinase [Nitrospirota bacterium]MBV6340694.1 HAMP domain-containing histidine kinase [Candidatus Magnetobacterium casensis]